MAEKRQRVEDRPVEFPTRETDNPDVRMRVDETGVSADVNAVSDEDAARMEIRALQEGLPQYLQREMRHQEMSERKADQRQPDEINAEPRNADVHVTSGPERELVIKAGSLAEGDLVGSEQGREAVAERDLTPADEVRQRNSTPLAEPGSEKLGDVK